MKIGIIGAMDKELDPIRARAHHLERLEKGGRFYWHGDLHGHPIHITRCDPGKVNAALAVQHLLDAFNPDCLCNVGSSGALSPDLEVGDLVVATEAIQHDFDLTGWGLKPGEILFDVKTASNGNLTFTARQIFSTDPGLTQLAFETAQTIRFEKLKDRAPKIHKGRIVSGDQFISSVEKAATLWSAHQALAVDMESAAIAHVCQINNTPFLCIRAISDKADYSASVSFTEFLSAATDNYGKVFDKLTQQLGG